MLCKILLNSYKKVSLTNPTQIWLFLSFVSSKTRLYLHCILKFFFLQLYLSVWGCCWEVGSNQDTITRKELFWDKIMSLSLTCWLPGVDYPALSVIVMMKAILHLSFNKALRFLISSSSEILMPLVPRWQQRSGVQKELPSVLYGLYPGARIQENSCYRGNILHILTSIIPAEETRPGQFVPLTKLPSSLSHNLDIEQLGKFQIAYLLVCDIPSSPEPWDKEKY